MGDLDKTMIRFFVCIFCCFSQFISADSKVEDLKKQVCFFLPSIHGWCTEEKAKNFIDLVLEVKPKVCVEIGVFGGSSLFPTAMALKLLKSGVVIGIDAWDRLECIKYFDSTIDMVNLNWWGNVNVYHIYNSYLHMLKTHMLEPFCITKKMTSFKAAAELEHTAIDILHLDGNRAEEVSVKEVELYLPKVVPGGYIWITDSLCGEKQPAIDLLMEACDVVKTIDGGNCILFKKR